jgi:tRNA threonylcarbamoyladenosine biosynthesis protein TsaB
MIMNLRIDTSDMRIVEVSLVKEEKIVDSLTEENEYGSQVLLPLIEKLLEKNNIKFSQLKGIEVSTGPGSYTGLRVGAAVANALGFSLGIPVNQKEMEVDIIY